MNNSQMLKFMRYQPPLNCSDEADWVQIEGSIAKITEEVKEKYGNVECKFIGEFVILIWALGWAKKI